MKPHPEDQAALDRSLADAQKIARRLSRLSDSQAYSAALLLVRTLIKLGAQQPE
jgi:hypothetical protein